MRVCVYAQERERERERNIVVDFIVRDEISPVEKDGARIYIHGISYPRECLINYQNVK